MMTISRGVKMDSSPQGVSIKFPEEIKVTKCKTRTYSYIYVTCHGYVKKESRIDLFT